MISVPIEIRFERKTPPLVKLLQQLYLTTSPTDLLMTVFPFISHFFSAVKENSRLFMLASGSASNAMILAPDNKTKQKKTVKLVFIIVATCLVTMSQAYVNHSIEKNRTFNSLNCLLHSVSFYLLEIVPVTVIKKFVSEKYSPIRHTQTLAVIFSRN